MEQASSILTLSDTACAIGLLNKAAEHNACSCLLFMCAAQFSAYIDPAWAESVLDMRSSHLCSVSQVVPTMPSQMQLAHGQKLSSVVVPAGIYRQANLKSLCPVHHVAFLSHPQAQPFRSLHHLFKPSSCSQTACLGSCPVS